MRHRREGRGKAEAEAEVGASNAPTSQGHRGRGRGAVGNLQKRGERQGGLPLGAPEGANPANTLVSDSGG